MLYQYFCVWLNVPGLDSTLFFDILNEEFFFLCLGILILHSDFKTLSMLHVAAILSASYNLCKQFGPRSGPTDMDWNCLTL